MQCDMITCILPGCQPHGCLKELPAYCEEEKGDTISVQVVHAGAVTQCTIGQFWAPRAGRPVLWVPPLRSGLPLRRCVGGLGQGRAPHTVHGLLQTAGLAVFLHLPDITGDPWYIYSRSNRCTTCRSGCQHRECLMTAPMHPLCFYRTMQRRHPGHCKVLTGALRLLQAVKIGPLSTHCHGAE